MRRVLITEIQEIVSALCSSEDLIDNALRSYLNLATKYKGPIPLFPASEFLEIPLRLRHASII